MRPPRILFVGMPDSVHAARWISQLDGLGWDLHLFPVNPGLPNKLLPANVVVHDQWHCRWKRNVKLELTLPAHIRGMWRLRRLLDRGRPALNGSPFEPNLFPVTEQQARRLASVIRSVAPDVIHSLMITNAGYLTLAARRFVKGRFPPWIVQNWGSDIQLFGVMSEHKGHIQEVMQTCDFYDCECERDVQLAQTHGFRKTALFVRPNGGGYNLDDAKALRTKGCTSDRRTILIKGYQGWAGRALTALSAVEMNADVLKDYRIKVYSVQSADVVMAGRLLSGRTDLAVEFLAPCSHNEMLRRHGQARVSIGLSIGDAISTSLLEAMLMGTFPIQSNTSAWNEWVENGKTALIVPPDDPCAVAGAIRRAVADDALVDGASRLNWETAVARLDEKAIRPRVIGMYEEVLLARRKS